MSSAIRFKRLVIKELFGPGSPTIDVPFRTDDRVTVLHGRNGSGKTITLSLITALRHGDYGELARYPFTSLTVEFSDDSILSFSPTPAATHLTFHLRRPKTGEEGGTIDLRAEFDEEQREFLAAVLRERGVRHLDGDMWRTEIGRRQTTAQIVQRYTHLLRQFHFFEDPQDEPDSLASLRASLQEVKFIRTDRLFIREAAPMRRPGRNPQQHRLMVEHLSSKIQSLVQEADQAYRRVSTQLDGSLSQRLFSPTEHVPSASELRARVEKIGESEERLQSFGLLKERQDFVDSTDFTKAQLSAFYVILQDRETKLKPFAKLAQKAEHLLSSGRVTSVQRSSADRDIAGGRPI